MKVGEGVSTTGGMWGPASVSFTAGKGVYFIAKLVFQSFSLIQNSIHDSLRQIIWIRYLKCFKYELTPSVQYRVLVAIFLKFLDLIPLWFCQILCPNWWWTTKETPILDQEETVCLDELPPVLWYRVINIYSVYGLLNN